MLSPGRFIVLEGIEGVGKTTQRERLRTLLTASNIPHRVTREPGGTALGEHVRDWILSSHHPVCSDAELLLLFAARAEHVAEVIQPALSVGEWVIADRFVEASFAYQGGVRQLPLDRIEALAEWTLGDMHPDLTILLDAPVEVSMARIQARGDALDRIEQERHPVLVYAPY